MSNRITGILNGIHTSTIEHLGGMPSSSPFGIRRLLSCALPTYTSENGALDRPENKWNTPLEFWTRRGNLLYEQRSENFLSLGICETRKLFSPRKQPKKLQAKLIQKASIRNTTRLTVVESDVRRGNGDEGKKGITVGMKIDKAINAFASAPPKSFILNRTSDSKKATANENAVVTSTLIGSYIIVLQKDKIQPLIYAVSQSLFGAEPVLTSNQEAYAKNKKQSTTEK